MEENYGYNISVAILSVLEEGHKKLLKRKKEVKKMFNLIAKLLLSKSTKLLKLDRKSNRKVAYQLGGNYCSDVC